MRGSAIYELLGINNGDYLENFGLRRVAGVRHVSWRTMFRTIVLSLTRLGRRCILCWLRSINRVVLQANHYNSNIGDDRLVFQGSAQRSTRPLSSPRPLLYLRLAYRPRAVNMASLVSFQLTIDFGSIIRCCCWSSTKSRCSIDGFKGSPTLSGRYILLKISK